jgi:hypothetical protein
MLSERELRSGLAGVATEIDEGRDRAEAAMHLARRWRQRRQRRWIVASGMATLSVAIAGLISLNGEHTKAPPTVAAIDCVPGSTVTRTPVVAASENGSVVLINNSTGGTVSLYFGDQQAVLPPGETEGTFPVSLGRQVVQCVSGGVPTRSVAVSVVAAR